MLPDATEAAARRIETGDYDTDQATIATFLDATHRSLPRMQAAGYPFRIRAAGMANLDAAAAAGLSHLDFSAQSVVMREQATHPPSGQSQEGTI
jgi:hypothetical protein